MKDFISVSHPKYEVELLEAHSQVLRRSDKYLYTLEVRNIRVYHYRVHHKAKFHGMGWYPASYSCTCHPTWDDAEQSARFDPYTRRGQEWFITRESFDTFETVKHRYKRG